MKNLAPINETDDLPTKGQIDFAATGGGTSASTLIQNNYAYTVGNFFYQGQTVFRVVGAFTSPSNATTTATHLIAANVEAAGRLFTVNAKNGTYNDGSTLTLTPEDDNLELVVSGGAPSVVLAHPGTVLKGKSLRIRVRYASAAGTVSGSGSKFEGLMVRPAHVTASDWVIYEYFAFTDNLYYLISTNVSGKLGYRQTLTQNSNQASSATANALTNINDFLFYAPAGQVIRFLATIIYNANATTTGSRFVLTGPANPTLISYRVVSALTATTERIEYANAYQLPAAASLSSAYTTGNIATVEGLIQVSASGYVFIQFAPEVAVTGGGITILAGSTLEVW